MGKDLNIALRCLQGNECWLETAEDTSVTLDNNTSDMFATLQREIACAALLERDRRGLTSGSRLLNLNSYMHARACACIAVCTSPESCWF